MFTKDIVTKHKRALEKSFVLIIFISITLSMITVPVSALSGSSFKKDRIIDDAKFYRTSSMSTSAIQSFLNSKVPSCDTNGQKSKSYYYKASTGRVNDSRDTWVTTTRATYGSRYYKWTGTNSKAPYVCLKNYKASTTNKAATSGLCSAIQARTGRTAAQIIYEVSQACGIDSKVLLVMLEKEQGLVSDDWPWSSQYKIAMGYGCPDDGSCSSAYYGFFNQVYNAARQLKNYRKNPGSFNYASGRTSFVAYQANNDSCGGTNITISNAATAALYNYTPYQPNSAALNNLYGTGNSCSAYGNRNFWRMYNDWFGASVNGKCVDGANLNSENSGVSIISNSRTLSLTKLNKTGSQCAEVHTWAPGYKSWSSNVATNLVSMDPDGKRIINADVNGDGKDELFFVKYQTPNNRLELHQWNKNLNDWSLNVSTNLNSISPSVGEVISGDRNGDGKDELMFVKYSGSSGKVEIHTWAPGYKSWSSNVATNLSGFSPNSGRIISADTDGNGKDELHFIKYTGTGSGKVEIHTWSSNLKSWASNRSTNLSQLSPVTAGKVIAGNTIGNRRDELIFVLYSGNSGKVEIHTWAPGYKSWSSNVATNLDGFDPAL